VRKAEAESFIELAAAGEIDVAFAKHFWEGAQKCAPGLSKNDVYTALRRGSVSGAPVRDDEYLCHKVKIRTSLPDFGRLEIVAAITVHDSLVCITIYDIQ
jgi:hypothetical protein